MNAEEIFDKYVDVATGDELDNLDILNSYFSEEEKEEYCQLQQRIIYNSKGIVNEDITEYINWCYENHLDINGLIPKGLSLDATGLNIY